MATLSSTCYPHCSLQTTKPLKGFLPNCNTLTTQTLKTTKFKPLKIHADIGDSSKPSCNSCSCEDPIQKFLKRDYKWGFASNVKSVSIPKGLSVDTIKLISAKKGEPEWMLEFRLQAYEKFLKMKEPQWSNNRYPTIDLQNISYYSEPKNKDDPELIKEFDKLGVDLTGQKQSDNAVDVVIGSVSIATTRREELERDGVIFCSISEAIREYPDLVRKYFGRVVPPEDNYYAALNSAVFSDGTFCYIQKDSKDTKLLETYFRINEMETGQFERTLIVVDERSSVHYLEKCTAARNDQNQLHAAVVELYAAEGAKINYSTVQKWYPGDAEGKGGIYNFVTKRGICAGARSKISWAQVETGSAITWKYPSVVLEGDDSVGEFHSVAMTKNHQQADTGTKMIHKGKNTKSVIMSKGISAGDSKNCYRGLVQVLSKAENARNASQCDSLLIGDSSSASTYPYIQARNPTTIIEHEATTSRLGAEQIFYFQQRGVDHDKAVAAIVEGFCQDVFSRLPNELKIEANEMVNIKGYVG